jgi:hypothetical protein
MSHQIDIDEIVREVLAQLRSDVPVKTLKTNKAPHPVGPASPIKKTATETTHERLELTDRLVTLATLENRLSGIRHLVVRTGTVVTPSARDALRARSVQLSYAATVAAAVTTLVLGMADLGTNEKKDETAAFVEVLTREGLYVEQLAATGMASVVSELADHAARGGRATVLLTAHPEVAVCLANRYPGVRGVGGRDLSNVRRAIGDVAANFVALDPAVAPAAQRRLLKDYCTGWPRRVPAVLDVSLARS